MDVRPAKTQISLGIRSVWPESSLSIQWVAKDPSFLHADSEDSDQTGRMPRLIWVFAGQISLGIRPVWSESSLSTQWVAKDPSFLHADSEDSDQTGRMPRLIWVFAGRTLILLVLSCRGSYLTGDWYEASGPFGVPLDANITYYCPVSG